MVRSLVMVSQRELDNAKDVLREVTAARQRQLELALQGRFEESAAFAEVAQRLLKGEDLREIVSSQAN